MESALIESYLKIKKNFWLKSYRSEYRLSLRLSDLELPDLLDSLLGELMPLEAFHGDELADLKGSDSQSIDEQPVEAGNEEELFAVSGKVISDELSSEEQSFRVRVVTSFKEFYGKASIRHNSRVTYYGALPKDFPLREIARAVPLEIGRFRMGLEFFQPSFAWASLGSAPSVSETLLISGNATKFDLQLISEHLKSGEILPFSREGRLEKLEGVILKRLNFSLIEDYKKKMLEG